MLYFKHKKRNSFEIKSINNAKLAVSQSSADRKKALNNDPTVIPSNNEYLQVPHAIPIQFQPNSQSINISPISSNNNYNKIHRSKSINENIFTNNPSIHRNTPYNRHQSESPFSLITLSEDIQMKAIYSKNMKHRRQKQKKQLREISKIQMEDDHHHRNHNHRRHHSHSHSHGHTHHNSHHHKHYHHNGDEHHYRSQAQPKRKQNRKSSYNSSSIGSKSRSGGMRKRQKRKVRRHAIIRLSSSRSSDRPSSKKSRSQELEEEDEKVQLISDDEKNNGHYQNILNSNVRMMNGMNSTAISSYSASPSKSQQSKVHSQPLILNSSKSLNDNHQEPQQVPISRGISQEYETKNSTIDNKSRSRSAGNVHKKKTSDTSDLIIHQHSHSRSFNKRIEPLSLKSPDCRHLPHIPSQIELDWNSHGNDSGRCISSSPQPHINVIVINNHSNSNLNEHMSNTINDAIAIAQAQQISQQLSQNFASQSLSSLVNSPPPQVYSSSNVLNDKTRRKKSALLDVNANSVLNNVDVEYAEGVSDNLSPFSRLDGDIVGVVDGKYKVMYAHGQEHNMNRSGRKNGSVGGVKYLPCASEVLPATNDCSEGMTDDDEEEESSFTIPSVCELLSTTNVSTGHRLPKNNVTGSGKYL